MNQTRWVSLLESTLNVGSGFIVALLVWRFIVVPILGITPSWGTNLYITSIFTVFSVARGYVWRRLFNNGAHLVLVRFVARAYRRAA